MRYEQRPWLAVLPWSQIAGRDGYTWTVLPHWPPTERRIVRPHRDVIVFTPEPMAMVTVLVPDEPDAYAALAASFGMPEVLARRPTEATWWLCPIETERSVHAHLRDWHGTLTSAHYHHSRSSTEALAYHDQLHTQILVHPLPGDPHLHVKE